MKSQKAIKKRATKITNWVTGATNTKPEQKSKSNQTRQTKY